MTRLVLFTALDEYSDLTHEIYGVEVRIEHSFFFSCEGPKRRGFERPLFTKKDNPMFLDFGRL